MIDANSQFFAILTNVGMAKQANADALGIPWLITQMGVGDANPNGLADPPNPVPTAGQTKLLNEWRRQPLNQLLVDPKNPAVIIAEQVIPADEGGKWIREIGLYDADGDLVAVANCAPSFKPLLSQGSGRTQIVRMNFIVTSTGNIQLKIDPAVVLATRSYVDTAILEVLPKNKAAGQYTRVKVNDRGVFVSGDNPETLAGMGIKDGYTKTEIEAMIAALAERVSFIGLNGPVAGAMRNLKATVPTPSTNITFAIEEVVLRDAAGNGVRLNNFNKSAVTTAVGVGGMDAGPAPASAVLSIYAIFNPATKVSGLLLCNQAVSSSNTYAGPNLPAGFTFSALISGWGVDASGMFRVANQVDRQVNVALTTIINMVTAQTARPVDISTIVPLCAREIDGIFQVAASTAGNALTLSISGSPLGHGARSCGGVSSSVNASMQSAFSRLSLLTPGMIYATTTGPTIAQASAYLYSYTI